jgi:uracil-DNA glycosylase family 4
MSRLVTKGVVRGSSFAVLRSRSAFVVRGAQPVQRQGTANNEPRTTNAERSTTNVERRTSPSLRAVGDAIVSCERCPRLRDHCATIAREKRRAYRDEVYWGKPVPGFGDPRARLLIVGLAPAAHGANRTGRVFTGDGAGGSGDFLMSALHRAGFSNLPTSHHPDDGLRLRDAFIAAAVRCAPPDNKPTPEELLRCLPHLDAEITALPRVRVVVALGKIAFDAYLQLLRARGAAVRPRPVFGHGRLTRLPNGIALIGCYHPSRQNTNTGKLTVSMMDEVFRIVRSAIGRSGDRRSTSPIG